MHLPRAIALLSAPVVLWLGLTVGYGQGTIVYGRLTNPYPPSPVPPPWDDSGYPMPNPDGDLVLDLDGNGQPDVGFSVYGTQFDIFGLGQTRVLTYPPLGLDLNSFLPVLPAGTEIGSTSTSGNLIWRDTLYLAPSGRPYAATYNAANNVGYAGYWQGVEGYTGIEFYIAGEAHYAWVRVGAPFVGLYGGYIYDYAYDTRPSAAILAGAVPEPSTWALLGFGFLILALVRRRC